MMKQTKKAFTLVELIIVITILAILATIGFMSFQSYTADARNSKRTNDISSLQSKLEVSVAKGTDILTLVTSDADSLVTNTLKAGSGTTLSGATVYIAGKVDYTKFGVASSEFSDPTGVPYRLGAAKTNLGAIYQFAATLEAAGDTAKQSFVKGLFLTGGTDNALGLIAGSGTTANTGVVNASTTDFAY